MTYINLKTQIPGPQSVALQQRRAEAVSRALAQSNGVAVKSARGSLVTDVDGNTFIDLAGGIGMMAVVHNHPKVVEAIQQQAAELIHPCALVVNFGGYPALAERLNALTPGDFPKKTLLANGGAEAVENAVKIARAYTGRAGVIVFEGGYHGRTNLTMSMTSKYGLFKKGFGPFASEVYRLPFPNPYRAPEGMTGEQWVNWCCWNLENALTAQIDGSALACIVIEPVLGEGGFIPTPVKFLRKIREICDRTGAVMIADEIQSGSGRTGRLYAIEHAGVVPDMIVSAKSLGAGMPISAVTGRAEIMDAPHLGGVGSTYGGSPVSCAAALAVLDILTEPGFLERGQTVERVVREVWEPLRGELPIGDIRGIGAMMAVEFVKDPVTKTPWMDLVAAAVPLAVQRGVLLMRAGLYSNCLRFLPALDIPEDMLREGLTAVADAVREAYRAAKAAEEVVPA
ncbi:aminotransferase class III-fold pyridoxal phosphate-dependent enzyme (plasmid) [Deinococcus metallilatus]|uniref:4-aminobutyrate aminotransferase/(S)-3-amino-2-methylpropionate transaminase n=1 Tax=Deinococcus metallilatus TaxID=1211322 RepID=A0ABR6MNQ7_9DEIO|nr:aminotransferase class III-fold pyridoxal phosphate-dependent enzyme [Deinococcus metallilatus]MBB5293571.1 4-aminobutyrate aminotransferase/(S)-3-amino-2-methylpropionate transaminase [Deinococcus metallilatus]QBY06639.1 aminotransferase class III-fold pyridoxal phosphate-dependent enzyme [Deinococcus metallilatus]RXJ17982.1 aminotransferase class III-fold pyridoxal phosphate-dependent enzyme [Deinococcus metallilatus]GMA15209.1 aspartate aminotransferase family protein [Deinococcus metalli